MTALELVTHGRERARVGPWNGDERVAFVAPQPGGPPASVALVRRCLERLESAGFRQVVTGPLTPDEQRGFLAAGFTTGERLHLLRHDLQAIPTSAAAPLRRGTDADKAFALAVDRASFEPFWRLDRAGLDDAIAATPHTRFRVAGLPGTADAYAVTGRHGRRGYLQRLAVDPAHRSRGLGAALVVDALRWLRRWRTVAAFVNTQEQNADALALYERLGFVREPSGLTVLSAPVGG